MPGTTDNPQGGASSPMVAIGSADATLARMTAGLINEARSAKRAMEGDWKKWREYYEGEQWANKKKYASWRVNNVINVCFANVETGCAVVMAMVPKLVAKPANEQGVETAERVSSSFS